MGRPRTGYFPSVPPKRFHHVETFQHGPLTCTHEVSGDYGGEVFHKVTFASLTSGAKDCVLWLYDDLPFPTYQHLVVFYADKKKANRRKHTTGARRVVVAGVARIRA